VDLADDLRTIADCAFPDLEDKAREQLSLDRFLGLIDTPTIVLAVCQKHPKNLDEAVMSTLETETHLTLSSGTINSVATAMTKANDHHVSGESLQVAAVQARQESMVEMMKSLTTVYVWTTLFHN